MPVNLMFHANFVYSFTQLGATCGMQRRAGAKGFGLFACEDLHKGQFIIEYIGEVGCLSKAAASGHLAVLLLHPCCQLPRCVVYIDSIRHL